MISFFYSVVYGIIGAPIASLRTTIKFAICDFLDAFPFLREWYAAITEGLAFMRAEIGDVSSTL